MEQVTLKLTCFKEIDLVEERGVKLFGYELKWGKDAGRAPREWKEAYRSSEYKVINRENHLDFIL